MPPILGDNAIESPDAAHGRPGANAAIEKAKRHVALLLLISEVQRSPSIADMAKAAAIRWKRCVLIGNWRLLCVYGDLCVVVSVKGRHITVTELALKNLNAYDSHLWRKNRSGSFSKPVLQADRDSLPLELQASKAMTMQVKTLVQGRSTIGIVSVLSNNKGFDENDCKLNGLAAGAMAARVVALLAERRIAMQQTQLAQTQAETELWRTTLDNTAMSMAIIAPRDDGLLLEANKALCSLLHSKREALLAARKTMVEMLDDADRQRFVSMMHALLARQAASLAIEVSLRFSDGALVPVQLLAALVWDEDGAPRQAMVQMLDLTQRHELDHAKSDFLATVSHELRTPLTSIIAAMGLFKWHFTEQVPAKGVELLTKIQRNADRLLFLTNDLLDMEKIIAGRMVLDLTPLSVHEAIKQVIDMASPYADQYGVVLHNDCTLSDVMVMADSHRLSQILTNLLSNASKFSPRGSSVSVSCTLSDSHVEISVMDQGPGIPDDFRGQIFQKFKQADSSVTRKKGGTGLGLAISKELARLMQGDMGFESETGIGSRFWVRLPMAVAASKKAHNGVSI